MDNKKYYELTIPQQNIWLVEQLNPNTTINNIYGTVLFDQKLDLDLLKSAINKVIETNDALRINICLINNKPLQFISDYVFDEIPVYILNENDEYKIDDIIDTIRLENMNIFSNKLYDFRIIQSPSKTYICIKTHHIISDAWSTGQLIVEQIKNNYESLEQGKIISNNPSYIEYIHRNAEYLKSEKHNKDKDFWQKYIKDLECRNEFEITENKQSKRIEKTIDDSLADKINSFCNQHNISIYTFFLSILSIYFSKIFGTSKMVFGTPFLNRKKANHEFDMIGMFISTLPISIEVNETNNFLDICKQVTQKNLACFKHSNYPYSEIQKEYQQISSENINLYEIAFSYQINKLEKELNNEVGITNWICNQCQNTPLLISFVNHFGERKLCYDYILQFFSEIDINNLHDRLLVIMKQVLKKPDILYNNINILSENDLTLLKTFNNTGNYEYRNETILSKFEKSVKNNKTKIAIKCGDDEISFSELDKKSNSVANSLINYGLEKNSPVAIIFDKSIEMIIAMLGILKSGCYYIPILPEENQERAEYIVKNSNAKFLVTTEKYSMQILTSKDQVNLNIDELMNHNSNSPKVDIKSSDLSCIIYTSGSTGTPKGVMIKHENIVSLMDSINEDNDFKFLPNDIAISLLKYSFDASNIDIYSSILNSGTLILVPKEYEFDPEKVVDIIQKEKVTRTFTVHKWIEQIQKVIKSKNITLDNLRIIGTGAEILKPQKFKYLFEKNKKLSVYNTYGPTESTVFVTKHKLNSNDIEQTTSPIGGLIPNTRALVLNSNNEPLPINCKGELVICEDTTSAKNISAGYLNLDELTNKKFIKFVNPCTKKIVKGYKTGDLVKINYNLELEFLGRKDDFKKINGGYLVSLNEVENRIQTILGNSIEACVVSIPLRNVNSIILYIVKKESSKNIKTEDIKTEIDNNITFYMKPKQIIEIDKLPLSKNGKVNRKKLEKMALEYLNKKNDFTQPSNKLEQSIYDAIKEIINTDFSITDDFEDDLGIDSLNMTILYSKLSNQKISLQDLYNYPTVKDLAHLIQKECSLEHNISSDEIKIYNASNKMNLEKILITGTTGFVGTHLLKEFAENENTKKIYCIVRQKINLNSNERFEQIINHYFDEETCKKIRKKAIVLNGDLRKENLGLDEITYKKVFNDVKTIINAAANVKHIGKYHTSYVDNVETVNNLIKICTEFHISLAHISTLSLNGYYNDNVTEKFTENTLNINQTFNKNPYLLSKYEAEQAILKSISTKHLNAKIFRIGNIMPRISDGVFQINYDQNGFLLAIKTLIKLKLITEELLDTKFYLTPVDECCKCICTILNSDYCNTIYHVESNKIVKLSSMIHILQERNIEFRIDTKKLFNKKLATNYSIGSEYLTSMLSTNSNKYSKDITLEILNKLDFEWKSIKQDYLENIINISMKIK